MSRDEREGEDSYTHMLSPRRDVSGRVHSVRE